MSTSRCFHWKHSKALETLTDPRYGCSLFIMVEKRHFVKSHLSFTNELNILCRFVVRANASISFDTIRQIVGSHAGPHSVFIVMFDIANSRQLYVNLKQSWPRDNSKSKRIDKLLRGIDLFEWSMMFTKFIIHFYISVHSYMYTFVAHSLRQGLVRAIPR